MKNDDGKGSLKVTETADGIVFTVHVQPRASRNEICGVQGDELKLRLTAPPVEDAANKLCVELIAKAVGVAKSRVVLVVGAKSRHKTIRIEGVSKEAVLSLVQQSAG
jgi:uncharacterized protein (TIGR00251 family)